MARKTSSRLAKRREVEAAEAKAGSKATKKRKTARKKSTTTRRKTKAVEKKQLVWGVFSGSLKEEARFPYDQRKDAEEKLEKLRSRGKKMYFIQPIKEVITAPAPTESENAAKDKSDDE
jgi:hypothetical protein